MSIRSKINPFAWMANNNASLSKGTPLWPSNDELSSAAAEQDIWAAYDASVAAMRASVSQQEVAAPSLQSNYQPPEHLPLIWQINTTTVPEKEPVVPSPQTQSSNTAPVMSDDDIAALRALLAAQEPPVPEVTKGQECPEIGFFLTPEKTQDSENASLTICIEEVGPHSQTNDPAPPSEPMPFCKISPFIPIPFEHCEDFPLPLKDSNSEWYYITLAL